MLVLPLFDQSFSALSKAGRPSSSQAVIGKGSAEDLTSILTHDSKKSETASLHLCRALHEVLRWDREIVHAMHLEQS